MPIRAIPGRMKVQTAMVEDDSRSYPTHSVLQIGLRSVCPRCGQGRLFVGLLKPGRKCQSCHLDYGFIDSGDGPSVFVILILGFVLLGLALAVESAFNLPVWLHLLIWTPVIIGSCLWALRFGKGVMIALQYKTDAHQGSLKQD